MASSKIQDRILDLHSGFRSFGYALVADPIEGEEELFISTYEAALEKLAADLGYFNRRDGHRNKSAPALANLHRLMPAPAWGVELAA